MTESRRARVCVVGAGVSGIVATAELIREGHEVVAYERTNTTGGLWNNGYDSLHLFTSKTMASFPGFPMPESYPLFPNGKQFLAYVNDYARSNRLLDHVRLNTEVTAIEPVAGGVAGWDVVVGDGVREHFDAVVIANGHLYKPRPRPVYPGEFTGEQIHTAEYRRPADFQGDSLLLVGCGPSATDIASDGVSAGKAVHMSVRSGRYLVPASIGSKTRMDFTLPRATPRWAANALNGAFMRVTTGRPEKLGLPAPEKRLSASKVTQSTLVPYWIQRGRIDVVPEIRSFDGKTVTFSDGREKTIDMIIWANGFEAEIPFAPAGLITWIDGMPARVVGGTLSPDAPNLYYNGWVSGVGSSPQLYSSSAALIAKMVSAQLVLDTPLNAGVFGGEVPSGQLKFEIFQWRSALASAEKRLAAAVGTKPPRRADIARRYSWAQVRLDQ